MNRIYQGKVTHVEIATGEKQNPWRPLERTEWEFALWRHHEIFQDAVNYYIVALAALAAPEDLANRLTKDLREQVANAWERFPRPVEGEAKSLRQSIAPWLALADDATLDDAYAQVLTGNTTKASVLSECLVNLLDELLEMRGDSKIRNGGRSEAPKFFSERTDANFRGEHSRKNLARLKLILTLHGKLSGDLGDFGALDLATSSKRANRRPTTGDPARKKLLQWAKKLTKNGEIPAEVAETVQLDLKRIAVDQINAIPPYEAGGVTREKSVGIPLLLIAKQLKFPEWSIVQLRRVLSLPKKWEKDLTEATKFAANSTDPLEIARGKRGYVFRAFTALPAWNPESPGTPVWKEFDIAAFKEALKSLNQFNQKTEEREASELDLRGRIAIQLGSPVAGWKPRKNEDGEEARAPEPLDKNLFQLARELEHDLTEDLADSVLGEERHYTFGEAEYRFRDGEWRVSTSALRGYRDLAEQWRKLLHKHGEALTQQMLEDAVKDYQRDDKNKKTIGSVPLFLRLCERKYWPLWQDAHEDSDVDSGRRSFLSEVASFHRTLRDFERSLEPINLTPAEPHHSRRLYIFSDAAKVAFGETAKGCTVECAIAFEPGVHETREQRVRLRYSGKRLLRDELQGGDAGSRWLQPMTRALGLTLPNDEEKAEFESAVSLMPDTVASRPGRVEAPRFLLNFPVTLDPSWIHAGLGKAARWQGQFNGTRDKSLHLHWPGTINEKVKGGDSPWWRNPEVIANGFTCFSVDLGQRSAGAWALLRVTGFDPRERGSGTKRPVREIGRDGEQTWFAEVTGTGMLRLPGEDQRVLDSNGKSGVEFHGKAGRNACEKEWQSARDLAQALLGKPDDWVGTSAAEKSFPEQSDSLIALAGRRLTRLNTFHRWSCFDPDRPEVAARREKMIERLIEELGHWSDDDVSSWADLVREGDIKSFRERAGHEFDRLRDALESHLTAIANRVVPLRDRSWRWEKFKSASNGGLHGKLRDTGLRLTESMTWIRGQRGLSLARIEQVENLRRLFLRYNRSFDREAGKPAKFGHEDRGRRSGEPCQLLLDKLDRMKEQRVNQTAHLILANALGLRLKTHDIDRATRVAKDIHGEYEKIPDRAPVDFIVIENLDRYLTSQGRAPSENSRLMKWAHRSVRDKIKMLAEEPFGIPVLETAAAFSSRFCALTGIAGDRCEERAEIDQYLKDSLLRRSQQAPRIGQASPEDWKTLLEQFSELETLNADWKRTPKPQRKAKKPPRTLFLPKRGGPLFLDAGDNVMNTLPRQADVNAAINIGLRAVAAPEALDILHKIRTERDGEQFKPLLKNAREKAAFNSKSIIAADESFTDKLTKSRSPNFFHKAKAFDSVDTATLSTEAANHHVVSGVGLWSAVNERFLMRLLTINRARLNRWMGKSDEEDDVNY